MLRRLGEAISPDDPDAALDGLAQWSPLRRLATPEEIAEVVVFLASPDARFVNGVALSVDGGSVITR